MKKVYQIIFSTLFTLGLLVRSVTTAIASTGITNPAIGALGDDPEAAANGQTFLSYFITIWRGVITVGGIVVIIYFIWAGVDWITAGDASKTQKARDKMTQAVIGLILLVGSFVIISFIGQLFFGDEFDILNPSIPAPIESN